MPCIAFPKCMPSTIDSFMNEKKKRLIKKIIIKQGKKTPRDLTYHSKTILGYFMLYVFFPCFFIAAALKARLCWAQ